MPGYRKMPVSQEDWERIRSIQVPETYRKILAELERRNNQTMTADEAQKYFVTSHRPCHWSARLGSRMSVLNSIFKRANAPYRLKFHKDSIDYCSEISTLQIFRVER